jgi:polyketide cyclase/dehydrase/lipid transport protein
VKPVVVSITVERPQRQVFAFLDVLGNHRAITDHVLVDWTLSGPRSGVGARARMRSNVPGPKQWLDMEVIASRAPESNTERTIGAGGKRHTTGTYTLAPAPRGGTRVEFAFRWERAPLGDRLLAPLLRAYLRRANARALQRLKALLERPEDEQRPPVATAAA